ncbi:hypothetical protein RS694_05330 [Rhodoferax saidenbachensis]|uniref:DUF3077 domain-containing protein n=2 Tax=Rhodoferax saidenbachensis TaxID=1484693 RepID=A0A1P8K7S0_9BURK|nr:hypothetical protein RS694_05330 [Rhodoferax saidenbachensis]
MTSRMVALRPMRDLMTRLPTLPVTGGQKVDYAAADPALLVAIAEDAEILVGTMHNGVSAIGQLLANSAVMVEDGTISADCLEALGFLMSELGDMAASCMALAAHCRRETADYNPS